MDERPISLSLKLLALLMFLFLLAPLLVVLPISFSGDNYMMFPPTSWSARWYGAIFTDAKMVSAFTTSIALACVVTVLSLAIGLPAAYALVRLKPPGAAVLSSLFTAPLLLPTIVLGLAILIVFSGYGLLGDIPGAGRRSPGGDAALCNTGAFDRARLRCRQRSRTPLRRSVRRP